MLRSGRDDFSTDDAGGSATGDQESVPAAFIVAAVRSREAFHIDDDAFGRWCAAKGDDGLADELPDWAEYGAGARLAALVAEARRDGVVTGDDGVGLTVYGDDDEDGAGFFVVLNNLGGDQRSLGLTTGWQELLRLDDVPPHKRARAYLEEVCVIANSMLCRLRTPAGTAASC